MAGLFYTDAQEQLENAAHFLTTVHKSTLALGRKVDFRLKSAVCSLGFIQLVLCPHSSWNWLIAYIKNCKKCIIKKKKRNLCRFMKIGTWELCGIQLATNRQIGATLKFLAGCQCRSWKDWMVPTSSSAYSSTELHGDLKLSICPGALTFRFLGKKVLKKKNKTFIPHVHVFHLMF